MWTSARERAREIAGARVIGFERGERVRALQQAIPLRPPLVPAALSAAAPLPPTAVRGRGKEGGGDVGEGLLVYNWMGIHGRRDKHTSGTKWVTRPLDARE